MSPSRLIAITGAAAALVTGASPALAAGPAFSPPVDVTLTIDARRANTACADLGYRRDLSLTFTSTSRSKTADDGRLIEVTRIAGTITGTSGTTAEFRAVRIFLVRRDGSEADVGLTYKYRIPGTTIVISGNGGDDRTDHEQFRPLCEALLT